MEIFRSEPEIYDLVITDLTMPNFTGAELARKFQDIRPDIPIILCTGYKERLSREDMERLGIKEVLIKPVQVRQLAEMMQQLLGPGPAE